MNRELIKVEAQNQNSIIAKTLIAQADDLAIEHESFNAKYIVGGRIALYELLGKIYALSIKLDSAIDKAEQVEIMRSVLAERYGIRTQDNTSDLTVLIRYITRADRKNAHVYARTIESARESGVLPKNMVGFIEHHGGIERIRACGVDMANEQEVESEEKISLAYDFLSAKAEIPFATFGVPHQFKELTSESCAYEFLICSRVGKDYRVIGKVPDNLDFENAAIKRFANTLCQDLTKARIAIRDLVAKANKKRIDRLGIKKVESVIMEGDVDEVN